MKILKKNDGALTNFEVLDFLRSRGATVDPLGCIGAVAASECKGAACNQTRKSVDEFLKRCESFGLAKAEKLNLLNLRPSTLAEIDPIIESCEERFPSNDTEDTSKVEELIQLVVEILPPPPMSKEDGASNQEAPEE